MHTMKSMLIFLFAAASLLAQIGGTGSIQGTVFDATGAIVPGAAIAATHVGTGVKTARKTTAAGFYLISPLQAGQYTVTVVANGFQTLVQEKVPVDALSSTGLNPVLQVGVASQQVTITDTPPSLNTTDASLGETLRNEVYTALPLAMGNAPRDPTAFVSLLPGVQAGAGNTFGNVLGGQSNSGDVYVEGMPATNTVLEGEIRNLSLGVSVEAIDQFQLETAGAAVMYQGQGAANFVLKSGTNKFHGAAYEYFRNTVLDARGFFARTRPAEHQNEFGFNLGGPIKRNKIFFFGGYDGYRFRTGTAPNFVTIPSAAQRGGDFSGLPVAIYDPQTTSCAAPPCTRLAFPGNVIPVSRISGISKFFQQYLPATTNAALQNNYLGSVPVGFNNDNTTNKVDWNVNDKNRLFGFFSRGHRAQSTPYRGGNIPLPYTDTRIVDEIPTTAQLRHTYVVNPNLLNQIGLGFSRLWVPITNATIDGDYPNKAGLKGLPVGEAASSFPEIAFAGPNAISGWRAVNSRAFTEAVYGYTLQDNVQWTHGKHAVTVGLQYQRLGANEKTNAYGSLATWNFSNTQTAGFDARGTLLTATGNSYAAYLLGQVNGANVTEDSVVGTGARYRDWAYWVQDNFKVSSKLTLNLGLRHDIWSPYKEVLDRMSFFNPDLPNPAIGGYRGALQFAGSGPNSCNCSTNVKTNKKLFGPRLGLAYSVNNKTVIRAGYAMMYTHRGAVGGRGGGRTGTGTLGFSASPSFTSLDGGISSAFNWDNGVPSYQKAPFFEPTLNTGFTTTNPSGGGMTFGDPDIGGHPPVFQNWNFGLQRAVTQSLTVGLSYVGSNAHFLGGGGRSIWSGQMDPKYLKLGNLLLQQYSAATLTQAQAAFPEIKLPYANFRGTISQMLRPFPQFSGISDLWGDVANSNYNSFQLSASHRMSRGITFNFNYTMSKAFDDTAGTRSAYNWVTEKAQAIDPTHVVNALVVFKLPFGKGQHWLVGNPVAEKLVSDWQLSGITTYRSGSGFGTIAASCNTPNAGSCYADYNPTFSGPVRINGDYGTGDLTAANAPAFLDKNAFVSPAAFTYGNTPRTLVYALRNPSSSNQNLSLRREFTLHEGLKLAFQADAFNIFNWVRFSGPNLNITSAAFGKITAQSNAPRVVQFNARITF